MYLNRRRFLTLTGRALSSVGTASLLHFNRMSAVAQTTADYRALVCVFLNGGNDGNNTIVPLAQQEYAAYAATRGNLALAQSSLRPVATLDGTRFGLHPHLAGLQRLFTDRRAAVVANVGMLAQPLTRAQYLARAGAIPQNLYSHADQQIQWQAGFPATGADTGWAGRTADRLAAANLPNDFPVVVSTAGATVFGFGNRAIPASVLPGGNSSLEGVENTPAAIARTQALEHLLTLDSGSVLIQAASATTREGLRVSRLLDTAMKTRLPLTTPFPQTALGQQMHEVAKVMQVRHELGVTRQIFFCNMDGFDTHAGQINTHAGLLKELDSALVALSDATLELGIDREVTIFTESEFGRTLQPSTGAGTDHAWGSHHFVIGGAVRGGEIYGEFPSLALGGPDDASGRGVWIPTSSLDQYGATLAAWFGVADQDLPLVFPNLVNFASPKLGFVG